ncbi:MAG: hypothetical protein IJQ45_05100 [Clostridia bacterium]|nr:hypothetical protein [Oscillospiraceae bacterium]MBR0206108.1 hypothetical protein [Clostridia bacterium]
MTKNEIKNGFLLLGIKHTAAPANYSPELFGRRLMSRCQRREGVSYSICTTMNHDTDNSAPHALEEQDTVLHM